MATIGKHVVAKQFGNAGYYAEVEVSVSVEEDSEGIDILFPDEFSPDWRWAVGFGIAYAREHLPREWRRRKKYLVTVLEAKGHVVDTTMSVIMFTAAWAFWKSISFDGLAGFSLDLNARSFLLPK